VTPLNIRIRKVELDPTIRARHAKKVNNELKAEDEARKG
jgi:hypothetical protein